jgi:hypothetical protein
MEPEITTANLAPDHTCVGGVGFVNPHHYALPSPVTVEDFRRIARRVCCC